MAAAPGCGGLLLVLAWRPTRADCGLSGGCPSSDDEASVALPIIALLLGCALSLGACHLAIRLWMRRRESVFLRSTAAPQLLRPQPPRLKESDPVLSGALPGDLPPRYETPRCAPSDVCQRTP
ncbi:hypothetical protein V5799_010323 [Amblyomma americanum]|uniref:Secreted protein n=1 Tax=Amblyomma americanum TaxID=6943 RepID=A0AAQ4F9F8_AMBAM